MGGGRAALADGERAQYAVVDGDTPALVPAPLARGNAATAKRVVFPQFLRVAIRLPAVLVSRERFLGRLAGELARDGARGAAFLCLPVLLAAGAAFYFALAQEPGALLLALMLAAFGVSAFPARGRPALLLPLTACFVFTLGMAAAKLETWRAATPVLGSEVTTRITGRIVRLEDHASGRIRLTIDITATERPKLRYAPERVRLTARAVPKGLQPGDAVSGLVRLMPPSGPVRPGSYDFAFASYFNGLGAIGFFMSGPERVHIGEALPASARPARLLEAARLSLANRIRSHIGGAEGEVAVAMIVGFRPGIPEEVNEWLRRSGLAHILSISGLHMALVALTVMSMLRAGSALFPGFSSRVPIKKYAAAAALAFCTLYLFISGADVAARRSYIMLAVMLAALIFDRAALTMRNVAIAALVIIALSPHEVVGPSFQMSFAATAALVAGYAAWTEWRRNRVRRRPAQSSFLQLTIRLILTFVLGLAATSLIAGTATALYGIWHFQRATPLALPANLAAVPFVSIVAMPSAVMAILTMPFGLDGFFLKIMGYAIAAVIGIANWFSDRSPFDAVGLIPLSGLLALTTALVIAVVSTTLLRLLALPFLALGVAFLAMRELPEVVIAEDARLVGVRSAEGRIAVNRTRPNGFTMEDWRRALKAEEVVKPTSAPTRPASDDLGQAGRAFVCGEALCLARHEGGAMIAHAESVSAARAACGAAALIIVDDATVEEVCEAGEAVVVTKRDLARRGAAAVRFAKIASDFQPTITFAIEEPWRPWHEYRAWSRSARGLAPYQRR